MISLPIADAQQIGQYYQAIVIKRKGRTYEAQSLLEAVANNRPLVYRARAIQALGALYHDKGQLTEALSFHLEAVRAASDGAGCDLLAMLMAHLEISHVLSDLGDHQGALAILENLLPLIHSVTKRNPLYFYLYHNELAIEFAELGRIAEAEAACAIALASPFAPAYPEWSETRDEIAARRQSVSSLTVAVQKAEADASQQVESERNSAPSHTFALNWFVCGKTLFQRTEVQIAIPAVIAHCSKNQIILERFGETIKPRAPPVTYP
ncbi:MAG TPA: tetratricopeptide repeat protein [Blastocatellia bacterium]|nr:tetratricopeptide repeat protein [Blastocatellia bacterium]